MTGHELLLILGVPLMFLATGLVAFLVSRSESDRFDRERLHPGE